MDDIVQKRIRSPEFCYKFISELLDNLIRRKIDLFNEIKKINDSIINILKTKPDQLGQKDLHFSDLVNNSENKDIYQTFSEIGLTVYDLFNIYNVLHQKSLEFEDFDGIKQDSYSSFNSRKVSGTFYTHYSVAYFIIENCLRNYFKYNPDDHMKTIRILEPCVGTGVFIIALIDYLCSSDQFKLINFNKNDVKLLIEERLYCVDIDGKALDFFKTYIKFYLSYYYEIQIDEKKMSERVFNKDLLFADDFISQNKNKFDIIFFNPPYELLKPNSSEFKLQDGTIEQDKFVNHRKRTLNIKEYLKSTGRYKYSIKGMLNLYKLFVDLTTEILASENGNVGFIVPLTLLGDFQCRELRIRLLSGNRINSVIIIPENNTFFKGITQSFTIVNLTKNMTSININLKGDVKDTDELFNKNEIDVKYKVLKNLSQYQVLTPLNDIDISIIKKYHSFKKIFELSKYLLNLRGEIDLTKYKKFISKNDTGFPLVRGKNIGYFRDLYKEFEEGNISFINNESFYSDEYVKRNKLSHLNAKRIACQQISNLNTNKRLKYTLIPPNYYLGNSCNYIIIEDEEKLLKEYSLSYESLLCLLNSGLYNWRFKLTSTNNHISNNEIDDLTIPLGRENNWVYSNLKSIYMKYKNGYISEDQLSISIDAHVFYLFNLSQKEIEYILKKEGKSKNYIEIVNRYKRDNIKSFIFNHQVSGLSDLDLDMVSSVPPGGNWKNIPLSVPSKRLEQIRKSGGRTTLYGRLEREMPSYTISTYFNRPGNGTFIHPDYFKNSMEGYTQDRLISARP